MERTLYGRRKGKPLRSYQSDLVARLLPEIAIDATKPIDPAALFPNAVGALHMEIGFGGGERLAREAQDNPAIGFIGCEPFVNGVAKLLARIERDGLRNVRLHHGDARDVLVRLPDACLDRLELLYPDPWPKRRQRKRRFVGEDTLALIARCLRPGAEFRFATDIDDYAGWTLAHVLRDANFTWRAEGSRDWRDPWAGWQPTRYEDKARREGRASAYLTFVRM